MHFINHVIYHEPLSICRLCEFWNRIINYIEMIIMCHELEAHVRSFLEHCLLPLIQASTTTHANLDKKISQLEIC